ncbi:F-box/kelch-repeat protein [Platanthera guangdongensis]|uniref:F-box/kelch-repeat protein n=1 Tax=Platanthera guangdongensis TaxID=2320717 RepID=A0ABR2MWE3_9ASPA
MERMDSIMRSNNSSSNSNSRSNPLLNDLGSADGGYRSEMAFIQNELENLSVSKLSGTSLSQKLKKKKKKKSGERLEDTENDDGIVSSSGCLGFRVNGSGCKVGSCEDLDINFGRKLSSAEDCRPGKSILENIVRLPEKFWRKSDRKSLSYSMKPRKSQSNVALIAVGGLGSLDEPLDSGEVYDPITDRWVQIARIPVAFGHVGSGAVLQVLLC